MGALSTYTIMGCISILNRLIVQPIDMVKVRSLSLSNKILSVRHAFAAINHCVILSVNLSSITDSSHIVYTLLLSENIYNILTDKAEIH